MNSWLDAFVLEPQLSVTMCSTMCWALRAMQNDKPGLMAWRLLGLSTGLYEPVAYDTLGVFRSTFPKVLEEEGRCLCPWLLPFTPSFQMSAYFWYTSSPPPHPRKGQETHCILFIITLGSSRRSLEYLDVSSGLSELEYSWLFNADVRAQEWQHWLY